MKFSLILAFLFFTGMTFDKNTSFHLVDKIKWAPIIIKAKCVEIKTEEVRWGFQLKKEVLFRKLKTYKGDLNREIISFKENTISELESLGCRGENRLKFKFIKGENVLLFFSRHGKLLWKEPLETDIEKLMEIIGGKNIVQKNQLIFKHYPASNPQLKKHIQHYILEYLPSRNIIQMKQILIDCALDKQGNRNKRYLAFNRLEKFYDQELECILLDCLQFGDQIEKIASMKILANHQCQDAIFPIQKILVAREEDKWVKKVAGNILWRF